MDTAEEAVGAVMKLMAVPPTVTEKSLQNGHFLHFVGRQSSRAQDHINAWKEAAVSISVSAPAAFNYLISLVCVGVSAVRGGQPSTACPPSRWSRRWEKSRDTHVRIGKAAS